jgi:site-specific recombinase XerD
MNTRFSFPPLSLASAFEQFLEVSSFARRTRESYAEDLAPLIASAGQQPVTALTTDVLQAFLARQASLAPATYNRRLAALRSFTRWPRDQGWRRAETRRKTDDSGHGCAKGGVGVA